jgi:hypothetical protein
MMKISVIGIGIALLAALAGTQERPATVVVSTTEFTGPLDMSRMALGQGGLSEEPMWENRAAEIRALRPKLVRLFIRSISTCSPPTASTTSRSEDRSNMV